MTKTPKKSKPIRRAPQLPTLRDGVSYGAAAAKVGVSKPHLYLVLKGQRAYSRSLIQRLEAEDLLKPLEAGIGRN